MTRFRFAPPHYRREGAITRRGFLLPAAAGAAAALSAACNPMAQQMGQQSPTREPVTLEYLTTLSARQKANHEALIVEAFEQAHRPHRLSIVLGDSTHKS